MWGNLVAGALGHRLPFVLRWRGCPLGDHRLSSVRTRHRYVGWNFLPYKGLRVTSSFRCSISEGMAGYGERIVAKAN